MRLKERVKSNFPPYLKKTLNFTYKRVFNRKTKIIFLFIFTIAIFILGNLSGLILSGNQRAVDLMENMGMSWLFLLPGRVTPEIKGIIAENVKIPINYVRGQFSNPEKIFIDINFRNYKKIEYKRYQALDSLTFEEPFLPFGGILVRSGADYVPAKIRYNCT